MFYDNDYSFDYQNNVDMNMNGQDFANADFNQMYSSCNNPMIETPQERVVHRNFVHEVPHVCPINTKIVNHHIYRHTYQPRYTCCEENVVTNEQCGSCCQFR